MKETLKICEYCGKEFYTKSKIKRCCSVKCSHKLAGKIRTINGNQFKRKYSLNDNFLKHESNEKYYFLGLMASDGNIYNKNNTISICQSGNNGLDIINYIKNILNSDYLINTSNPKVGKQINILSFRSKEIQNDLKNNNIISDKTKSFVIPYYILEDENRLRNFLIGYIDGDGCIGVYNNCLCISFVCNKNMFEQLKNNRIFEDARFSDKGTVIDIRFNGIKAVRFGEWLYNDMSVYKSYKFKKYEEYINNMLDISERMKYNFIREKLFEAFSKNPNLNCIEYAKNNNLDCKYVYANRKKWKQLYYKGE